MGLIGPAHSEFMNSLNLFLTRMKHIIYALCWLIGLAWTNLGYAQTLSGNRVNFQVTYDAGADRYTAWVVPQYNVPNANNTTSTEFGGTAQFTIKAPSSFSVLDIQDVNGVWEKNPLRLGPGVPQQMWIGLDPAYNYWVVGKAPQETNYGTFQNGVPVRLFTFRGNGCFGPVIPLPPGDAFINAADMQASLNAANSFYSRSGQPAGGNVVPLEQFVNITGNPADCRSIGATPDTGTLVAGTPTSVPVLTNDTNNGVPASPANVTVTLTNPPASGTAVVNANGTISYTPAPNFTGAVSFTYTICDRTVTTRCSSAPVSLMVLPADPPESDTWIKKLVSVPTGQTVALGASVSFSVVVMNLGPAAVTNLVLTDELPGSLSLISSSASKGNYAAGTGLWSVGSLSVNQSATLVVTAITKETGVLLNEASLTSQDQVDPNSLNNTSSACLSVPIPLCGNELLVLRLPAQYQSVSWFRNGQPVQGVTTNTLTVGSPGVYSFVTQGSNCPDTGCCPIVVVDGNCCKPVCVPIGVTKQIRQN